MSKRQQSSIAKQIRSSIKSIVAQLDAWEEDQRLSSLHQAAANAAFGGQVARLAAARSRAKASQETPSNLSEPPCEVCNSSDHITESCGFLPKQEGNQASNEDPSASIHRGIVHRLYSKTCELYHLHYPRFYSELKVVIRAPGPPESRLTAPDYPDYQALAVSETVRHLILFGGPQGETLLERRVRCTKKSQRFFSQAFELDFQEFWDLVVEQYDELRPASCYPE
jgi:hypothetical protein